MGCEIDLVKKAEFINSCDVMVHARSIGETFGAAIGEFSSKNKPVITCDCGDTEHIEILSDKGIIYRIPDGKKHKSPKNVYFWK